MKLEEARNRYVFKTKVYLKDEAGNKTEDFVEMREPNMKEMATLGDDEQKNKDAILKFMPNCIIGSSIEKDDGSMLKGNECFAFLAESATMSTDVMTDWLNSCPFTSRNKRAEN